MSTHLLTFFYYCPLGVFITILWIGICGMCSLFIICGTKEKATVHLACALFLFSVIAILYFTLLSRNGGIRHLYLIPFDFIRRACEHPRILRTEALNIALFIPLAYSLKMLAWHRGKKHTVFILLLSFGLSVLIEVLQYVFALGTAETDDVIMNFAGAVLGCLLQEMTIRLFRKKQHE